MTLVDRITSGLQSLTAEIKEQRPVQRTGFGLLVNSAAEANIFSYVIPAGQLGDDRTLKLEMAGDLLNNSGASQSITFRVSVGGTLWADSTGNIAASPNRRPWRWELNFSNLGAANQNYLSGLLLLGAAGGATTGLGDIGASGFREVPMASAGQLAINTTQAQTIAVFTQLGSANTAFDLRRFRAIATIL
jgi:hypothetical protein